MKTLVLPFSRRFVLALALCGILASSGCITNQVREAINDAEVASVSADYGLGVADPSGPKPGAGWREASAKIDAIVAQHPESPDMNAALRVRQAVMLLNNQQFNLAKVAFEAAPPDKLHTPRDQALKNLQKELLWWYESAKGSIPSDEYEKASGYLANISKERSKLKSPSDDSMRDWLAALRAWIALKLAADADNDVLGEGASQKWLEDGLNTFAGMLPEGETSRWLTNTTFPNGLTLDTAMTGSNRRRFYADDLIAGAKKAMRQSAIPQPNVADPYFKARLEN
jgi:hypothetical protein